MHTAASHATPFVRFLWLRLSHSFTPLLTRQHSVMNHGVGPASAYKENVMRPFLCLGLGLLVPPAGGGPGTIGVDGVPWQSDPGAYWKALSVFLVLKSIHHASGHTVFVCKAVWTYNLNWGLLCRCVKNVFAAVDR